MRERRDRKRELKVRRKGGKRRKNDIREEGIESGEEEEDMKNKGEERTV